MVHEVAQASVIVRKFTFTFDTLDLLTGHVVWTPNAGDVVYDAWMSVGTAWDQAAYADIGTFTNGALGWFGDLGTGVWNVAEASTTFDGVVWPSNAQGQSFGIATKVPFVLVNDDPIKIIVTTTGAIGGGDPGAAQGSATLYLVTATPA